MKELIELVEADGFKVRMDEAARNGSILIYGNEDDEDRVEWDRRSALTKTRTFSEAVRRLGLRFVNQMPWIRLNMPNGARMPHEYEQAVVEHGAKKGELAAGLDLVDLAEEAESILLRLRRMAVAQELDGSVEIGRALALVCRAAEDIEEFRNIVEG